MHEPWALRSIIEVETDDGRIGLGESYGDLATLGNLDKVKAGLSGLDPFDLNGLTRVVYAAMGGDPTRRPCSRPRATRRAPRRSAPSRSRSWICRARSPAGPSTTMLGGKVRDRVPYSAYLFYKFERHHDDPGYPADDWGEALSHEQMVGAGAPDVRRVRLRLASS